MRSGVLISALAAVSLAAVATTSAHAETWDYASAGTANAASYTFSAAADGLLKAYFMPSTGTYRSALGVKVNGTTIGRGALPLGETENFVPFTFGSVHAGDSIEFFIDVTMRDADATPMGTYFSTVANNADGLQHVWAAPHFDQWYLGPEGVPEGTFIGFEDTTTGDVRGDLNYRDYTFVVPNLNVLLGSPSTGKPPEEVGAGAVPEPASWGTMLLGFGVIGGVMRRRRTGKLALARA